MILLVISFVLGVLGFYIGANLQEGFVAFILGGLGFLAPLFYVLESIYKRSNNSDSFILIDDSRLKSLRDGGVFTEAELEDIMQKFSKAEEKAEKENKYNDTVIILSKLMKENIISESEFQSKIDLIKTLYKQ